LGESIPTARHGLKGQSPHNSGPLGNSAFGLFVQRMGSIIAGIKQYRIVKNLFRNTKENYDDLVMEIA
jgi:hypothetical protein